MELVTAKQMYEIDSLTQSKLLISQDVLIEKDLIKKLGMRLKITPNKQGGGKVVLQYASVAELDMIINMLEQKPKPNMGQQT